MGGLTLLCLSRYNPAMQRRHAPQDFFLLSPAYRAHKDQLLDLCWPDLDPTAANNNLNKTLYQLQRTLCPESGRPTRVRMSNVAARPSSLPCPQ